MKSIKSIIAVVALLACQAAPAQPAPPPGGPGGGGRGAGGDRRPGGARDQFIRHEDTRQGSLAPSRDAGGMNLPARGNLSEDERRTLRDQIRDHGRDIYKGP